MRAMRQHKSKSTSIRIEARLQKTIELWLKQNQDFNLTQLVNMAVRKFITQPQVLTSVITVTANDKKVEKLSKRMMKDHSHMLEKLK